MEGNLLAQFKDLGTILVLALSAIGSGAGAGAAGMAAIGAWKKNFISRAYRSSPYTDNLWFYRDEQNG